MSTFYRIDWMPSGNQFNCCWTWHINCNVHLISCWQRIEKFVAEHPPDQKLFGAHQTLEHKRIMLNYKKGATLGIWTSPFLTKMHSNKVISPMDSMKQFNVIALPHSLLNILFVHCMVKILVALSQHLLNQMLPCNHLPFVVFGKMLYEISFLSPSNPPYQGRVMSDSWCRLSK